VIVNFLIRTGLASAELIGDGFTTGFGIFDGSFAIDVSVNGELPSGNIFTEILFVLNVNPATVNL
jgi:hypothetical protein